MCSWEQDCLNYQKILQEKNHILGGYCKFQFRIQEGKQKLSEKNEILKTVCKKHLNPPDKKRAENVLWKVAKHHFPIKVVKDYNEM